HLRAGLVYRQRWALFRQELERRVGEGILPVEKGAKAEADFFCVAGLDDRRVRPGEQVALQRRPPFVDRPLRRVAEQRGRLAADAGDVFDDEVVVTEVGVRDAQAKYGVGQNGRVAFQAGCHFAAEQKLDAQAQPGAAAVEADTGIPILLLVL